MASENSCYNPEFNNTHTPLPRLSEQKTFQWPAPLKGAFKYGSLILP